MSRKMRCTSTNSIFYCCDSMKMKFLLPLLFFFVTGVSESIAQPDNGIRLTVTNLRNDKGFVLVSLFKEGQGFPDKAAQAFRTDKVAKKKKKAVLIFPDLPAGSYAISILHDENNDQQLNKNAFGLPKEGYGFSNNVIGAFGPPSYKRASFIHKAGALMDVPIKTRY